MNDKTIDVATGILSIKRVECLLEEVLILQAKAYARQNGFDEEATVIGYLKNVDDSMKRFVDSLDDAKPE